MKKIDVGVKIKSTPEVVWNFLTTLHKEDKFYIWHPDHVSLRILRGDLQTRGSLIYFEELLGKDRKKLRFICQITDVVPNKYLELRSPYLFRYLVSANGGLRLEKNHEGVNVNIFVNYGVPFPLVGGFLDKTIEKFFIKSNDIEVHTLEELEILKKLIEESPKNTKAENVHEDLEISVVVPAYNEEKNLPGCLESIKKQELKPIELIVVDNNSTDSTSEIAKSYGALVVPEHKQGMINARNRGFNEARGDIIARTDSDTDVPTDWTKRLLKHFQDPDVVAVSGPSRFGKKLSPAVMDAYFSVNKAFYKHPILLGPNMAVRKSAWLKVRNEVCQNDDEVHEDIDLSIHLRKYGKIIFDPNIIVNTSARRMRSPKSFFYDYLLKWGRTLKHSKMQI